MQVPVRGFSAPCAAALVIAGLCVQGAFGQAFPTSRDALKWPFAQNSIWNMPIGSAAQYVFANIQPAQYFDTDENIIFMTPDAPVVDVYQNTAGWDPGKTRCGTITTTILDHWPVPDAFTTEGLYIGSTPNASSAALLPDKRTIHQGQPFHRCGAGGKATYQYTSTSWIYDIYTGDGILGAHGGSGLSALGGTIRVGELVPGGVIRHAMEIALWSREDYYSGGPRWPAVNSDGDKGGSVPAMKEGSLCALRPDFDTSVLLSGPGRIVARAFMNYGAYAVDDCAWDAYYLNTEWGPDGRVIDEFRQVWGYSYATSPTTTSGNWGRDLQRIYSSLYVVDNNTAATIGGGGTPRQPLAPPFQTASINRNPSHPSVGIFAAGQYQFFDVRGRLLKSLSGLRRAGVFIVRVRHNGLEEQFRLVKE